MLFTTRVSTALPKPFNVTTASPSTRTRHWLLRTSLITILPLTTHRSVMLFVMVKSCSNGGVRCVPNRHFLSSINSAVRVPRIARRSAHGISMLGTIRVTVTTCPSITSCDKFSCSKVPIAFMWNRLNASVFFAFK